MSTIGGVQMLNFVLLAAKSHEIVKTGPGDKSLSLEWGLVLIALVIGLAITLMPPKRTYEVKKQKES